MNTIRSLFTPQGQSAIITLVNGVLGALIAFNVVLTQTQLGAITFAVNAVMGVLVLLFGSTAATQAAAAKKAKKAP